MFSIIRSEAIMNLNLNLIVIFLLFLITVSSANKYYCLGSKSQQKIEGNSSGEIFTHEQRKGHYSNNQECSWTIIARDNERIQVKVDHSSLQWSPPRSLCTTYDHVDIRDANGSIASWCGKDYPREVVSQGSWLKIIFQSDDTNPRGHRYSGAKMNFQTFDNTSCPPDWLYYNNSCYTITATQRKWDVAQRECNRRSSNLLVVQSGEEWTFLRDRLLKSSKEIFVWTGLNDISHRGILKWIDNSSVSSIAGMTIPTTERYKHCGVIHRDTHQLFLEDCNNKQFAAICKAGQMGTTRLYRVPLYNQNKGEGGSLARVLLLGVGLPAILLLIGILCCFLCRRRIQAHWNDCKGSPEECVDADEMNTLRDIRRASPRDDNASERRDVTPSAPPGADNELDWKADLPPSYDEIFKQS